MARQSPNRGPAMSSQDHVCLGTKLGGRCHDSHIHSSAGVAVRGEEERDAIQEPRGTEDHFVHGEMARGGMAFLMEETAWAKSQRH